MLLNYEKTVYSILGRIMRKIIHLSDLHIGFTENQGGHYAAMGTRFNSIIDNIAFTKQPASNYIVLVTGDLVDTALNPANYEETMLYFNKLRDYGYTVLPVPGNHDYGTGALASKKFVNEFKRTFFGTHDIIYPKLDIIDKIAFIGLDSMAEELHWYDRLGANGELGDPQLERFAQLLTELDKDKSCKYRVVYLHHHPFDPEPLHELKDSEKLKAILKGRRIDALLYGHNHKGKKRNGRWDIPRCYDAGSSTRKLGSTGYHRVIDLNRDARFDYDGDFHGDY